jgi:putative transposase
VVYHDTRHRYPLAAQVVVRAVAKVADAYRLDRKARRTFALHGAFPYDGHILSFKPDEQTVSIWMLEGRQRIGYRCGACQRELLEGERGEADLCYLDGAFYLFVACEVETPEPEEVEEFLGVDTGVANIATDGDGTNYSSAHLNGLRHRHARLRAKLQQKGTKASRRLLKRRRRKEARFARDVNHCISKQLVQRAKDTGRGIAIEDLTGIRDRVTVHKAHRRQLHSWAFHDLRQKIEYKARRAGVPVVAVDPRNTSRTCPACGCVDKRNRPEQRVFSCVVCGFSGFADHIAAVNIGRRAAAVNQPNVSDMGVSPLPSGGFPIAPGTSYRFQPIVVDSVCKPM